MDHSIYHITHVDNLASIIAAGALWSDAQRIQQGFASANIGYSHIKARRLRRPITVSAGGMLGDYVPFNFCPRSIMLYVVSQGHADYAAGQQPIIHLVSSIDTIVASARPWAFTDIHADLGYASQFDSLDSLDEVDWDVMPVRQWGGDSELKEKRQAEFLVHDWCPWNAIVEIGVINDAVAAKVHAALATAAHKPNVVVHRDWYY
ncbi:MAG: DUF4433 domain-containing protein [Candidatus Sedimenticola sp. (ex Thyasira tokunagai)]